MAETRRMTAADVVAAAEGNQFGPPMLHYELRAEDAQLVARAFHTPRADAAAGTGAAS
jgi:hypothetical protein